MTRVPLRSVPTGPGASAARSDPSHEDVDIASADLDADLELAVGTVAIGTTAAVVAASLLDFLR
jgi:hypothetical protein